MLTEYEVAEAKENLDHLIDLVNINHIPIKIIRKNSSAYVISEDD